MPRKKKTGHYYYPRYPTIYAGTTYGLSLEEHGALTLLIDHYMLTRSPLPGNSDRAMADILHCGTRKWVGLKTKLVSFFKPTEEGLWRNSLCEQNLDESDTRIENAQNNGKKGGRPPNDNPAGLPKEENKQQSKQTAQQTIHQNEPEKAQRSVSESDWKAMVAKLE